MDVKKAANCRWARPTLQQPFPDWLAASDCPWTCEREETPMPLDTTEICVDCPNWQKAEPPA